MNQRSETLNISSWEAVIPAEMQNRASEALENGKILYFPSLPFSLSQEELLLLSPEKTDPKSKNISYDLQQDRVGGALCTEEESRHLKTMISRYAHQSRRLMEALIPHYSPYLFQGKTSLRTVEILGRRASFRKDDTRLHVDSFPSNPVRGRRILRMFTNINPDGKPRVWRAGEPFDDVVRKMGPRTSSPIPGTALLLKLLRITKGVRTPYDHYMLQIHDRMKRDLQYQKNVPQEEIQFPAGSSWIVYTDQVSHAAMSGQHVLEQTFYMPVNGLRNPETAPLSVLEQFFKRQLV
ncbi:MAG: Kdo hydroxylase family protein [Parachlamydia sp.]|nr:Kdo hydroxylase family protein [Parachlamydia sp.]